MQNKGLIRLIAILIGLVCVYQLYFTYKAVSVENDAVAFGVRKAKTESPSATQVESERIAKNYETRYLDSIANQPVYNFIGLRKYTFKEVKEFQLPLGLDLKGGMNVTLEVSVVDLIHALSGYSTDPTFTKAIELAKQKQIVSQDDFVTLFGKAFEEVDPNAKLAAIFNTLDLRELVSYNSTNAQVISVIRKETDAAIDNSFQILRTRIDRFGVTQPNIQQLQTKGRILVELPGVKDEKRVRKLLQGTANLEFWETYENNEVYSYLLEANKRLREVKSVQAAAMPSITPTATASNDTTKSASSLVSEIKKQEKDSLAAGSAEEIAKNYPLFSVLTPNTSRDGQIARGPIVGYSHVKDTAQVNTYLKMQQIKSVFPRTMIFRWTAKPMGENENFYSLIAIKVSSRDGRAPLDGGSVTEARQDFGQNKASSVVDMTMNAEGAKIWQRITRENVGKSVAVVLDDYVQSYPTVQGEIPNGRTEISGQFTVDEAKDLANMLKSGKMPAPAHIVQEEIVGPTLGKESIQSGMYSFLIAFMLVLGYMLFFYSKKAGWAANVALLVNLFFLIGILASLGAVLTLPGIAGIVLTMGMAVDANVLINERIEEEVRAGKGMRLAVKDGYNNAYSAIIDGQVTTLLTGIVLYVFGSGPIKGFATTLIIGIITSLFTSIFISRFILERWLDTNKKITFVSKISGEWLRHVNMPFIQKRKIFYVVSSILISIAILSIVFKGMNYSIDFKGGRTYVVRLNKDVMVEDVARQLATEFGNAPEVKTFGANNQIRITTDYRIAEATETVDNEVEAKLYNGMKPYLGSDVTLEKFLSDYKLSSQKVGPTISDDIKKDAVLSVFFALMIIFLYIAVRFRNWQFGLGGLVSLAHDVVIVIGLYSLLDGWLSFSLAVDMSFIAAVLTIIGYSINDTVIVFDRIREYVHLHPKQDAMKTYNDAMNSTLRRTFSTSLTVLVVLFAIFLFGGIAIKGFVFALLFGILFGTYSSVFVATPIAYDTLMRRQKKLEEKK
ncbi:MAG: protein translocase subunit SecDF [Prolixibacteraceae bacterium]|jgi:SecD/SecF fusion protein|nr:protein translocase subunit SecDF [Prolixibacteraceae bacterium]